jgi:GNAT superfamily N-acetyltransferase
MRKVLPGGYELDDDPERVDVDAVHDFLANHSYWAAGRPRETVERLLASAQRLVGLYGGGGQVGFSRTVSDGVAFAYLADVYVLPEHRGGGLGLELVRFSVEEGPFAHLKWLLHTADMHPLYRKLGFGEPDERLMARAARPGT